MTDEARSLWDHEAQTFDEAMPDRPARPAAPLLVAPSHMPRRGRGGSEQGRSLAPGARAGPLA